MGNGLKMSKVLLVACFWINKERSFYFLQRYSFREGKRAFCRDFLFVFCFFAFYILRHRFFFLLASLRILC